MNLDDLIRRVKRRETPLDRALYRVADGLRRADVPVPAGVARAALRAVTGAQAVQAQVSRAAWHQPLFRARCESVGPGLQLQGGQPYVDGGLRLRIGAHCTISGATSFVSGKVFDDPLLEIGDHSYVGWQVTISAAKHVRIGSHVLIANGVFICDNPGHPLNPDKRRAGEPVAPEQVRPVDIGDDVWLGTNVVVMPGVRIGAGTVVGAGAVVTRDLPARVLAAGNPARVLKSLDDGGA